MDGSGGNKALAQNGDTTNPLDSWDLRREKAVAAMDVPHVFVTSAGYELPFGRGKHWLSQPGVGRVIFGGWQLNGILTLESGYPTDIRSPLVPQNFATFNVPNLVLGQSMYLPNPRSEWMVQSGCV